MSKKIKKQAAAKPTAAAETPVASRRFGYEEMLTELEAIVADAEVRLAEEEATA
ncbi:MULTISPECIES: hypothetical protein [Citrobacter]|uniref:hypothetical protein n=1 Tax=Citrobacter TaxID=544 RepID=UPI000A79AF2E|nr:MULTISPECIES: hypothetical protein [Citrobacter]EIQ7159456.1 hypothetical protein [Citrobacter sedlakii]EKJ8220652.1 hypothetical protein [Citrobacter sedlakii]EKX8507426.1 hypothetical protein [Citrobacter sedlakii]MBJ9889733.1 hypothetical protein [Citrobacter sedlakii]MBN6598912.1 hypothetical protein [Citrobacter sedlakii]